MITDLIGETQATKEAIDSALEGVHEAEKMNEQPQIHAPPPSYEADLFGGFDSPAPAPAAENTHQQMPVTAHEPALSTVSSADEEEEEFYHASAPRGHVETVTSSDDEGPSGAPAPPATEPIAMFTNASPAVPRKTFNDMNHGLAPSTSAAEVEEIKEQARLAEQTAKEAEDTRRSLAQQADDLRQVSEQAESELHEREAHPQKKNLLFGSKRKEMVRRTVVFVSLIGYSVKLKYAFPSCITEGSGENQARCRREEKAIYGYADPGEQRTSTCS